jgi:hypothetical protein
MRQTVDMGSYFVLVSNPGPMKNKRSSLGVATDILKIRV